MTSRSTMTGAPGAGTNHRPGGQAKSPGGNPVKVGQRGVESGAGGVALGGAAVAGAARGERGGRTARERCEDVLCLRALAGAPGYVPYDPHEVGRVASESRHLSSLRQRLGVALLPGER